MASPDLIRYALIGTLVAVALFIRLRRLGRSQRLRPATLWIIPTIFILLAAMIFAQFPPHGFGWLWVATGLAAGALVGWQRARLIHIGVDPATGELRQRSSPYALVFLAALVLVRWALHWAVMAGDARWNLGAMLVSDIFVAFAVGVLSFYRIELYMRARRLQRAA